MKDSQKKLVNELYDLLVNINEEGLNDDEFYNWLNENYFFEQDLEEIIYKVRKAKENFWIKMLIQGDSCGQKLFLGKNYELV